MAELIMRLGKRLFISKRNQCIRGGVVAFLTHALVVVGVLFALELVVILFGLHDVFLPLTQETLGFLSKFFL